MPDMAEVRDELLTQLMGVAKESRRLNDITDQARALRTLAEAWAWLHSPSQPHGGSSALSK